MKSVQARQEALLEIVGQETVLSQEELLQKLAARGITATQATLSRDLKTLNIIKVSRQGYRLPQEKKASPSSLSAGIVSIEMNVAVGVIRSQPGFAPALATFLDRHPLAPIMGTIAGDDTILIVLRQGFSVPQVLDALSRIFPNIQERYVTIPE